VEVRGREVATVAWIGKISALVLTYNRKELLVQCLQSILGQVEPPDEVIVLDNASTDGTCEYLEKSGLLKHDSIALYRLQENTGPSGGVDTLFRLAEERGSDWLWYMDDDTIAEADALKELKNAYSDNFSDPEEVGFLKSVVVSPDGSPNGVPQIDLRSAPGQAESWAARLGSGLVKVRCSTFVSIMVPRTTLMRVGKIYSDFRFYGEDTDFTLRTTEVLEAYLVGRSKVTHLSPDVGRFRALAKEDPTSIDMERYYYRNNLYFRWYYYSFGRTVLYVGRCLYEALLAVGAKSYPLRRMSAILRGLLSGLILVMHGKAGPSHLSSDQQPLPLQLQPKPVSE
jgi:GT2 family glycosyltransferase